MADPFPGTGWSVVSRDDLAFPVSGMLLAACGLGESWGRSFSSISKCFSKARWLPLI